mmetsp:Transcript_18919/g.75456  ORF Transcript_18919/g.75456 Transcript_18919/m.75456 type:complete len:215 (+) Transcript_18919:1088-1732(+)
MNPTGRRCPRRDGVSSTWWMRLRNPVVVVAARRAARGDEEREQERRHTRGSRPTTTTRRSRSSIGLLRTSRSAIVVVIHTPLLQAPRRRPRVDPKARLATLDAVIDRQLDASLVQSAREARDVARVVEARMRSALEFESGAAHLFLERALGGLVQLEEMLRHVDPPQIILRQFEALPEALGREEALDVEGRVERCGERRFHYYEWRRLLIISSQ